MYLSGEAQRGHDWSKFPKMDLGITSLVLCSSVLFIAMLIFFREVAYWLWL